MHVCSLFPCFQSRRPTDRVGHGRSDRVRRGCNFGRNRLATALCKLAADKGLLSVETFAMLGDSIGTVKTTLKTIIGDDSLLGADPAAQELALTSLAAIWRTCSTLQEHFAARRAKMEEDPSKVPEIPGDDHAEFREQFVLKHPDVLLPHHREPHRKFVERIQRDFLVHGSVPFYEVGEMRTRSEQIAQKSGLSKNAEDLLKVVTIDQPSSAASESHAGDGQTSRLPGRTRVPEHLRLYSCCWPSSVPFGTGGMAPRQQRARIVAHCRLPDQEESSSTKL